MSRSWPRRAVAAGAALATALLLVALASAKTPDAADDAVGGGEDRFTVADRSFSISGTVRGELTPGRSRALNLSIRNLTVYRLSVTELTVDVLGVHAPNSDATHPCTRRDFAVRQPRLVRSIEVGPGQTRDLAHLGLPSRRWPRIAMRNTGSNQDGCKDATLRLAYTGAASRSR